MNQRVTKYVHNKQLITTVECVRDFGPLPNSRKGCNTYFSILVVGIKKLCQKLIFLKCTLIELPILSKHICCNIEFASRGEPAKTCFYQNMYRLKFKFFYN